MSDRTAHRQQGPGMRLTDIFIERPVLSCVVSALVLVLGLRAEQSMPVEQFPHTVSGEVEIETAYYGADPATVAGFVTTPLEGKISQAEGIETMTSSSTSGLSDITVHLKLGYDPPRALAEIQSYVTAATAQFPAGVQQSSITLHTAGEPVMSLALYSSAVSAPEVGDYVQRVVVPRLQAVSGVQTVRFSPRFNLVMRVWTDPDRLATFGMTPGDVWTALSNNNLVTAVGNTLGASTMVNLDVTSSLHTPAQFAALVVRQAGQRIVRLGDVARVAFGSDPDDEHDINNGFKSIHLSIKPTTSADTLAVAHALEQLVAELRRQLPATYSIIIVDDAADYIRASIREVLITLAESLAIVACVVFAFLGSLRSVLVPLVTIPLSLIGTLALMALMGFSINLLTLLALVLAIGLVVDDAIIVVENVNRHLALRLGPMEAASLAAGELVQPILAMTVVLIAAFAPLGLQGGLTGALFTQFAFTLAGAVTISAVLALTLSPMMSSRLLRARQDGEAGVFGGIHTRSEHALLRLERAYRAVLRRTLRAQGVVLAGALVVLGSTWFFYTHARHELSPKEDTGTLEVSGSGAPNSTADALARYEPAITAIYRAVPEIRHFYHVDEAPNVEGGFDLVDWSQRSRSIFTIAEEVEGKLSGIAGLDLAAYVPPYLPGADGLPIGFVLQSTGSFKQLGAISDAFLARARSSGLFAYAEKDLKIDQPQSTIVVDRPKLSLTGLTLNDLGVSLNAMLGGGYTGYFSADQRSYKLEPLAMRRFRLNADQLLDYPIRQVNGAMVTLRSVARVADSVVPESIAHFQQLSATTISALPAPGVTQGQAYEYLRGLAAQMLPAGFGTDTVGSLRQFVQETNGFAATFALGAVVTYLALAALFESFLYPLVILVSVPLSLAGALLFVWLGVGGASLNLFTEVGLVTLMGLITKHGILIVQVAKEGQEAGLSKHEAILRACGLRLRPILMTTSAMVLGVMPLVLATGAGAASRFVMGLVIAAGLSIGTGFTLFVLPAVFMLLPSRSANEHPAVQDERSTGTRSAGLATASLAPD
jgi:multidrug efflux pump